MILDSRYGKPCRPAELWLRRFATLQEAWQACTNPRWMFWLLYRSRNPFWLGADLTADKIREKYPVAPAYNDLPYPYNTLGDTDYDSR